MARYLYPSPHSHRLLLVTCHLSLVTHDFDDHAFAPLPVPFPVEHPLPGPEIQLARRDRHDHLVPDGETAQVGGGVVFPGVVVPVPLRVPRRDAVLQPVQDVMPQPDS